MLNLARREVPDQLLHRGQPDANKDACRALSQRGGVVHHKVHGLVQLALRYVPRLGLLLRGLNFLRVTTKRPMITLERGGRLHHMTLRKAPRSCTPSASLRAAALKRAVLIRSSSVGTSSVM